MNNFIRELRRREVFRTAGLYVGICWILIEVGSVLLPVLGAPDWVVRGTIVAAVVGFPVMLDLAWFFDATDGGIEVQGDTADVDTASLGVNKNDYAIIGLLIVALIVSVTLNVKKQADPTAPAVAVEPALIRLQLGEQTPKALRGLLAVALTTSLEAAPHVAVVDVRDVDVLVSASLLVDGDGYRLVADGSDMSTGESFFSFDDRVKAPSALLSSIADVSNDIRDALDDPTVGDDVDGEASSFSAASLDAAQAYVAGLQFEADGTLEQAAMRYAEAFELDPQLGRAAARLAIVLQLLGRDDEAADYWASAMVLSETLTGRERLELSARFSALDESSLQTAESAYSELTSRYPADVDARAAYAAVAFRRLDFSTAVEKTREVLRLMRDGEAAQTRLSLYAMYQGDWATSVDAADEVIDRDASNGLVYLPLAMANLAKGDVEAAKTAYGQMAAAGEQFVALSVLGLADIDLYFGDYAAAEARLSTTIEQGATARHRITLAESLLDRGDAAASAAAAREATTLSDADAVWIPAAMMAIERRDVDEARVVTDELTRRGDPKARAYGRMLEGLMLEAEGRSTDAIFALRDAIDIADLWLIRLEIGKAYLRAGSYTQALDEFTALGLRRGEATALFFDDQPTYRYVSELSYWRGRVREALGNEPAARQNYEEFLVLRPQGGVLADDAAERLAGLSAEIE